MSDISKLEESLNNSVEEFRTNAHAYFSDSQNKDCTMYDIDELAKYTFYALDDFKKAIIEYLKKSG